jgi:hypothetical protein
VYDGYKGDFGGGVGGSRFSGGGGAARALARIVSGVGATSWIVLRVGVWMVGM